MPWTAAAPAPSARRRRRGGLIYPPAAAGPSSMGLPRRFFLSPDLSSTARVAGDQAHASPIEFLLLPASSPPAALLRRARRPRGGRIGVGLVGGAAGRGRPGTGERGRPQTSRDSRGLKFSTDSFRLVGRLRKGRSAHGSITRVPLPQNPEKQDSPRIAWPR
jgi:hypothetical protein